LSLRDAVATPDDDSTAPDEGPATGHHGPRLRIASLMIAVAAAALVFRIAVGSEPIVTALVLFVSLYLIVQWRARYRRPGDTGLVVLGVGELEFGNAMVYAAFVLVLLLIVQWFGRP
jgi:hypothetical protein